jgi:hypothetical protein
MSTVPNDVQLYHEMVASSVDLSNAHVSQDGVLTGECCAFSNPVKIILSF